MITYYLAVKKLGRKSLEFFQNLFAFEIFLRYFYYLCSPLFEDKSAQPAETQCFKGKRKYLFKVIEQCYNQRKQNLEGSRKAV